MATNASVKKIVFRFVQFKGKIYTHNSVAHVSKTQRTLSHIPSHLIIARYVGDSLFINGSKLDKGPRQVQNVLLRTVLCNLPHFTHIEVVDGIDLESRAKLKELTQREVA